MLEASPAVAAADVRGAGRKLQLQMQQRHLGTAACAAVTRDGQLPERGPFVKGMVPDGSGATPDGVVVPPPGVGIGTGYYVPL